MIANPRDAASEHKRAPPLIWLPEALAAVFWGFLGVRKCKAMARDSRMLKPAQVIVVGIACAAALVGALQLIVRLVMSGL